MRGCLTDMELAVPASRSGPIAERDETLQHLLICERCREILTQAVIALRSARARDPSVKPVGPDANDEIQERVRKIIARLECEKP